MPRATLYVSGCDQLTGPVRSLRYNNVRRRRRRRRRGRGMRRPRLVRYCDIYGSDWGRFDVGDVEAPNMNNGLNLDWIADYKR